MVERSPRLNVARVGADDEAIASTIDGLAAEGLLPNLRGVQAYVVGAGVSQGGTDMGPASWSSPSPVTGSAPSRASKPAYSQGSGYRGRSLADSRPRADVEAPLQHSKSLCWRNRDRRVAPTPQLTEPTSIGEEGRCDPIRAPV